MVAACGKARATYTPFPTFDLALAFFVMAFFEENHIKYERSFFLSMVDNGDITEGAGSSRREHKEHGVGRVI